MSSRTLSGPGGRVRACPVFCLALLLAAAAPLGAQAAQDPAARVARLVPSADRVTVAVGERVDFTVRAVDASGRDVEVPLRVIGPRDAVAIRNG